MTQFPPLSLKAVIFDLDGCLVDSEPLSLGAIAAEMRALGIADATPDAVGDKFLGVAISVITDHVAQKLGRPAPPDFAKTIENRLLSSYQTQLKQIPGAADLLQKLEQRNFAMSIATGGSLTRMAKTLEIAQLAHWFKGTATSADEVKTGKPAPDIFQLALKRMGTTPKETIVIEDSPHGIKGARAAGVTALGFVGGSHLKHKKSEHGEILKAAGALKIFDDLGDIAQFVTGSFD